MAEKVLVSACLTGIICRWHGRRAYSRSLVKILAENDYEAVKFCPEMASGLPCPRPPVKRMKGRVYQTCPEKENRAACTGQDVTEYFIRGAELALQTCKNNNIKKCFLCRFSPSCDRNGITGKLLAENGIEIINLF